MRSRALNLRTTRLACVPLALFAVAVVLTACGEDGDDVDRSPNGVGSPTEEAGTPTDGADRTDGSAPTGDLLESLPADYPETFPLYPGSRVTDTARFADQVRVNLETGDSHESVASFFREVASTEPWEPLAETDDAGRGLLVIRFRHVEDPVRGQVTIVTAQEAGEPIQVSLQFTVPEVVGETPPTASPADRSQPSPTGD